MLADNQLAMNAGWDEALLRLELADLSELGFDLGLVGFGEGELERLLAGSKEGLTEDDDAPALPEKAVTQPGDLWVLGDHRLLCGDATVMADVERVLDGSLADMTWTDPPYNVAYGSSAKDKLRGNKRKILNDDLGSGFEAFLQETCANILSATKGGVYLCMSSSELHTLQKAFTAAGGKWSTFVIWAKHTFTLGGAIIKGNTNRSSMAGRRGMIDTGAVLGIRVTSGSSTSRRATICIRPKAGGVGRTRDPQFEQEPGHRARSVRGLGVDPDRLREDGQARPARGAGFQILRRDHQALAGMDRRQHGAGGRRTDLQ